LRRLLWAALLLQLALGSALAGQSERRRKPPHGQWIEPVKFAAEKNHLIYDPRGPMQWPLYLAHEAAKSRIRVLITGPTGSGKEGIAQLIHTIAKPERKMIALNAGDLRGDLLTAELFGHEKGAFTGAVAKRRGLLELANQSTLFLDEVQALSQAAQDALHRVLHDPGTFRPRGSNTEVPFTGRVITATNQDLKALVEQGRFREDLLYRLDGIRIELPALAERRSEIIPLAQHFLRSAHAVFRRTDAQGEPLPELRLSHEAQKRLAAYTWPGNVRELKTAMEHAAALAYQQEVGAEILPDAIWSATAHLAEQPAKVVRMKHPRPARKSHTRRRRTKRATVTEAVLYVLENHRGQGLTQAALLNAAALKDHYRATLSTVLRKLVAQGKLEAVPSGQHHFGREAQAYRLAPEP
jgi:DNA-binding NtrC family response regulator